MTEQAQPASETSIESRMAAIFSASPEVATPEPQAEVSDVSTEEEPTPQEAAPEEPDDGLEDFEIDEGRTVRLDKETKAKLAEWKEGHLRREDYTQKTQALADITRQAQLTAETIQIRQAFDKEIEAERTELNKVQAEIDRYKQVDWSGLEVETYIKLRGQFDTLKERAKELNDQIQGKAQQLNGRLAEQRQKLVEEGQKYLSKTIKGWGEEAQKLAKTGAKSIGYTDQELDNVYDARFAALAWKAAQYDRLQESKGSAMQAVQKAPPVVKPGAGTGQQGAREQRYKDARSAMKKDPNSINAAARVFLMRGGK